MPPQQDPSAQTTGSVHKEGRAQPSARNAASSRLDALPNLADWRFQRYLTMQLLPLFYVLLLLATVVAVGGLVAACFWFHPMAGLVSVCLAPLVMLVAAAVIRAALEYLIMAHRIMRIIERMDALPGQMDVLSRQVDGITGHVDTLIHHVDDIHEALMHLRPLLRSASLTSRLLGRLSGQRGNNT